MEWSDIIVKISNARQLSNICFAPSIHMTVIWVTDYTDVTSVKTIKASE